MLQLLPGHGWLDVVGVALMFLISIAGFFAGLALLGACCGRDADGIPERWIG
jgi:hypothetical protein